MSALGNVFGHKVHKVPAQDTSLVDPFCKVGIEVEVEACNIPVTKNSISDWTPHRDDSLRNNGMEFTTNGGMVGSQIREAINTFCDFAIKNNFDVGYPRAGIHLHVDMTDMNENNNTEFLNCVLSYILFEKALFRFAGEWREACGFCDPICLSQRDFGGISQLLYGWAKNNLPRDRAFSKYQAINFIPLYTQGTLEFRHLPTTFDKQRILDWVNICTSFRKFGKEVNVDPVDYLNANGLGALVDVVFTTASKAILPYVRKEDVMSAIADARHLRILHSKKPVPAYMWNEPDNPFLLSKRGRVAKPAKVKTKEAVAEPARPQGIPLRGGRVGVDIFEGDPVQRAIDAMRNAQRVMVRRDNQVLLQDRAPEPEMREAVVDEFHDVFDEDYNI